MRRIVFYFLFLAMGSAFACLAHAGESDTSSLYKLAGFLGIAVSGFGLWLFFPNLKGLWATLFVVLVTGLLLRICIFGMPVSDDVYRYLWEGQLTSNGISAYEDVADGDYYRDYRDVYWEQMNHRERLTAYPPLALSLFAAISRIAYEPWAMKATFVFFDFGTMLVLAALLVHYRRPLRNLMLYAVNPVLLFAFAGEGHYDSAFVFITTASVYCFVTRRFAYAWVLLGVGIQLKIVACILAPWFFVRGNRRDAWFVLPALLVPCAAYPDSLINLWHGFTDFGMRTAFNGPLHEVIRAFSGSLEWASRISYGLFGLWVLILIRCVRSPMTAVYGLWIGFILCSSIVHYWYLSWLAPFAIFVPGLAWLWISGSSALYFLTSYAVDTGGEWALPEWAMWLQWLPFVGLLLYENRFMYSRFKHVDTEQGSDGYSVVIPVYNDADCLENCLDSLLRQTVKAKEVIVVDGGSNDESAATAVAGGALCVLSELGRGKQIARGIEEASGSVVVVLHADSFLPDDAGERMLSVLEANPHSPGGVLGQRFDKPTYSLVCIEALNDMRATFGGACFGDQVQFFRRDVIDALGGFPEYPLMEDMESSYRLMRCGPLLLLDCQAVCSTRSWVKDSFIVRCEKVMRCILYYRWKRLLGDDVSKELYAYYYGDDSGAMNPRIMMFVKAPLPGKVKTRLAEALGDEEACRIYKKLVDVQLDNLPSGREVSICYDGAETEAEIREWINRVDFAYERQVEGGLGERLSAAFKSAFEKGKAPVVAIGGDCPYLDRRVFRQMEVALKHREVVVGPAYDGGYYLIATQAYYPELFEGIEWGSDKVCEQTIEAASQSDRSFVILQTLEDVDDRESYKAAQENGFLPGL